MKSYGCLLSLVITMLATNVVVAQVMFEPTADHEILMQEEGTWTAKGKMWMPGAPEPTEFEGTEVNRSIGGMWIVSDFKGNFMGQPFEGHAMSGYDMDSSEYFGTWLDSMSPYMSKMSGTYDADKNTMTFNSTTTDPTTGKEAKGKNVVVYKNANSRHMTMYSQDPENPEEMYKSMEIMYTRSENGGSTSK